MCISTLHPVFSYCFAPACEELTLKLRRRFMLVLVPCLPDESPEAEAEKDSKPATPIAWQAVKQEHFWMWSLAYFGKLIKFSEVGQLFLSLSRHAFHAGYAQGRPFSSWKNFPPLGRSLVDLISCVLLSSLVSSQPAKPIARPFSFGQDGLH